MLPPVTSPTRRASQTFVIARTLMAALTLSAVVAQYAASFAFWSEHGEDLGFRSTNFISFFTIDSNLIAVVALTIGAVLLARGSDRDPSWFAVLRASAITYMAITGIVYNTLLRDVDLPQGVTVWWSNEVLHLVATLYMLVDWLWAPGARRVQWRTVAYIAVFPIIWVTYTMLRGPQAIDPWTGIGWYPYPFLNPLNGGYGSVWVYIAIIAVTIVLVGAAVVAVWRRRGTSELPNLQTANRLSS